MIIIHRCQRCAHPDQFHTGVSTCSYGACRCEPVYGPPEIIPTWDSTLNGRSELNETIYQPGTVWTTHGGKTCGCDQCWELYREATGV